jgi:hypothetical protein
MVGMTPPETVGGNRTGGVSQDGPKDKTNAIACVPGILLD